MIEAFRHVWRLCESGPGALGLSCSAAGLFLGETALIERREGRYVVRPAVEIERLLTRGYMAKVSVGRAMQGFRAVANALAAGNLCRARIAAVHLRLPDLPDAIARLLIETEDLLLGFERRTAPLARGDWNPADHPRDGGPPNAGWFAPTGGDGGAIQVAQNDERDRAGEENLSDPMATVRQAQWESRIQALRQIDPRNPALTYVSNPGAAPTQDALNRLTDALEQAASRRVTDRVMPGGVPIGALGGGLDVRELPGGIDAAKELFDYLRVGGQVIDKPDLDGTLVKLIGNAGYITFRPVSDSRPPAVEVNMPGRPYMKLHFFGGLK